MHHAPHEHISQQHLPQPVPPSPESDHPSPPKVWHILLDDISTNNRTGSLNEGQVSFDIGVSPSVISPKPKLADKGKKQACHILLDDISTNNRTGSLNEGHVTSIVVRALIWWLCCKIQRSHIRVQSIYTFTSPGAQALEQGNFKVKPRLCPSSGPFILNSYGKLCPLTPVFSMEVMAPVLPLHLNPINYHLPLLIVQLISFGEAISKRNSPEACYRPNVLRQLNNGVGSEPM
jgi:hypothetical protein